MSKKNENDNEDIFMTSDGSHISMITEITEDVNPETENIEYDKEIPVLALRNLVMFPHVVLPVTIGRNNSLKLVNAAYKKKNPIALVCQL